MKTITALVIKLEGETQGKIRLIQRIGYKLQKSNFFEVRWTGVQASSGDIVWSDNDDATPDDLTLWTSWPGITITDVIGQMRVFPAT